MALLALLWLASSTHAQQEQLDQFRENLGQKLSKHRYFSKIELEWVWDHEPFVFLVQKPSAASPRYAKDLSKRYAAEFAPLHKRFTERYAQPLQLSRRATWPRIVVVVFATPGDFTNYKSTQRTSGAFQAWFNENDRFVLLQEDPFRSTSKPSKDELRLRQSQVALALMQAHGATLDAVPGPPWFTMGMSLDLARNLDGRGDPSSIEELVSAMQQTDSARAYLDSLQHMLSFMSRNDHGKSVAERAGKQPFKGYSQQRSYSMIYWYSATLFHFLEAEARVEVRDAMRRFTEDTLKGRNRGKGVLSYLPAEVREAPELLEREFWTFVWARHLEFFPESRLDSNRLAAFIAERFGVEPVQELSDFGTGTLLDRLPGPRLRFALALVLVQRGELEAAEAELKALLEAGSMGVERLERELTRVAAWRAERSRLLEALISSGKKLRLTYQGKRVSLSVQRVADGRVHFRPSSKGPDSLGLGEVDALSLADAMGGQIPGYQAGWVRAYPYVLADSSKAKRALTGEAAELVALAEDVEGDYSGRRKDIAIAAELLELTRLAESYDLTDVVRSLELVRALWERRNDTPLVMQLASDLRLAASHALGLEYDSQGPAAVLHGEVDELADGVVRLSYDFSDEQQLEDWPLQGDRKGYRDPYPQLRASSNSLEVSKQRLVGLGAVARRHLLEFEGPQSLSYSSRFLFDESMGNKGLYFRVSLCTSFEGDYLATLNSSLLERFDLGAMQLTGSRPAEIKGYYDVEYRYVLAYAADGLLSLTRGDGERVELQCSPGLSGAPRLWFHSDFVVDFDDIILEGKPTEASLDALRERYVAQHLAEMKL